MNIVNTEMVIETLLGIGFDKVDNTLLTLITGKIVLNREKNNFVFKDEKLSDFFNSSIKYDGTCFKIKDKFFYSSLYTNKLDELYSNLKNQNQKLTEYLENLNYNEIVLKKMELLNIKNYNELTELFSNKEINIIENLFDNQNNLCDYTYIKNNNTILKKYKKMISRVK